MIENSGAKVKWESEIDQWDKKIFGKLRLCVLMGIQNNYDEGDVDGRFTKIYIPVIRKLQYLPYLSKRVVTGTLNVSGQHCVSISHHN